MGVILQSVNTEEEYMLFIPSARWGLADKSLFQQVLSREWPVTMTQ